MKKNRGTFVASDGETISYVDIGEGMPFLWIHGWGGCAELQCPFLEALSLRGFRCLCFDQRGCGQTKSMKNLGVDQSAKDAKELLEHLGIDNAIMLGYSMGAAVLFSYLDQFGTAHLSRVIIGDMSPKPLNDDQWKFGLYQGWYTQEQFRQDLYDMEHDYAHFAIHFAEQTIFPHTPDEERVSEITPAYIAAVHKRAEETGKTLLLQHFLEVPEENKLANRIYWESCDSRDFRHVMQLIDVPAALFFAVPGSIYDPHTAYWMASQIKDVTLFPMHGCTHMASGEKPQEFIDSIVAFSQQTAS